MRKLILLLVCLCFTTAGIAKDTREHDKVAKGIGGTIFKILIHVLVEVGLVKACEKIEERKTRNLEDENKRLQDENDRLKQEAEESKNEDAA